MPGLHWGLGEGGDLKLNDKFHKGIEDFKKAKADAKKKSEEPKADKTDKKDDPPKDGAAESKDAKDSSGSGKSDHSGTVKHVHEWKSPFAPGNHPFVQWNEEDGSTVWRDQQSGKWYRSATATPEDLAAAQQPEPPASESKKPEAASEPTDQDTRGVLRRHPALTAAGAAFLAVKLRNSMQNRPVTQSEVAPAA